MTNGASAQEEAIRNQGIALFTFLKELAQLRTRTIRDLAQYEEILWLSEIPREPQCHCATWYKGVEGGTSDAWLEVHKPELRPPPDPGTELLPWLVMGQIEDSSGDFPELRSEISVENEIGEERQFERRRIEEYPQIKELWESYIESAWWPWAEVDRRLQAVQRVYTRLFSIYQKQQRLGEQYEVVLGLGLLSWKTSEGHHIRRHIVTAQTDLQFELSR